MFPNAISLSKSIRTSAALLGIATMLSLSACGSNAKPVDGLTDKPTDEPSVSSTANPEDSTSPEASESPDATEDSGMKFTITYNRPERGTKTSVGEPVEDAEKRFTEKALTYAKNGETESELLDMGYKTCGFMLGANSDKDLFNKITEEYGTGDTEVLAIMASGTASKTLCPEFADF
jgi:hypothetical protein